MFNGRTGDLIGKSIASGFKYGMDEGTSSALQLKQDLKKRKMLDEYEAGKTADLYNAIQQKKLNENGFFDKAQADRDNADNVRSHINRISQTMYNPEKSATEIFKGLDVDNLLKKQSFSLSDYIKQENPFGAGDLINGKGYQYKNASSDNTNPYNINLYNSRKNYNKDYNSGLGGLYSNDKSDNIIGSKLSGMSSDIKKTVEDINMDFWDDQTKLLKSIGAIYDDYSVNPVYADMEEFRNNPLTQDQKRFYNMAKGGNTQAAQHLYNEIYPQMKLRNREYITPDGRNKVNEEIMYNISPDGRYSEEIVNKQQSPYMSQKDLEDYKYNKQLGLIRENAKYKGSGNVKDYVFTPNQLEELILNDYKITDPNLRNVLHSVNKNGRGDAVSVYSKYKPNLHEVKHNRGFMFGFGNNNQEYEKYNQDYKTNQAVIDYAIKNDGGADFLTNPINEDEFKKSEKLGIKLEPTDKLNIIKYTDINNGYTDEIPISIVKELINYQ